MASNLGLVSCYAVVSPKAPHHTPHLGLLLQNATTRSRRRVGQNCAFLRYSPMRNPSPESLLPLMPDLLIFYFLSILQMEKLRLRETDVPAL